jgi:hypothetical protein
MRTKQLASGILVLLFSGTLLYSEPASAQNLRGKRDRSSKPGILRDFAPRISRDSAPRISRDRGPRISRDSAPRISRDRSPGIGSRIPGGRTGSRSSGTPNLNRLGNNLNDLAGALERGYNNYRNDYYDRDGRYRDGYGYGYDSEREYAKAYRDVGIANAIASVLGAVISADQNARYYRSQGGHYERRQVVITPGYYVDERVWVPDFYDPQTRTTIRGHYEMRQRWVPEVYGYQDVWVPDNYGRPAPYPGY